MKKISVALILCMLLGNTYAQVISETMLHNGLTRSYNLYVPTSYTPGDSVPLVFCLHGLGSNGPNFMGSGFNTIADTAKFIAVYPTALYNATLQGTAWNCGLISSTVDDIGFMNALIDTISANYGIDTLRIHATGFSLGGFMTNRMGCEMSERIASIASVSGLIGKMINCNPSRSLSMMHMHGTNDGTITWDGLAAGYPLAQPVDTVIKIWKNINNCPEIAAQITLPDIENDNYTIDHYDYSPCDDNTEVELYKINGAGHEWMSSSSPTPNDVDSRVEIWRFFYRNRFPIPEVYSSINKIANEELFQIIPNPATGSISLVGEFSIESSGTIHIFDISGREVATHQLIGSAKPLVDISELQNGMYLLRAESHNKSFDAKFVIIN